MKKAIALFMTVLMFLSTFTLQVFAETTANTKGELDEALNAPGGTLEFTSEGDYPWYVYDGGARSSNNGVAASSSYLTTTVTTVEGDVVQFDYMSFGQSTVTSFCDGLAFFVDNVLYGQWARVTEVTNFVEPIPAGEHTLKWVYSKDGAYDGSGDYAWLDNIYVGAPIQAEEIVVDELVIPVGVTRNAHYTILPETTYDKSVTFEIEDTSIATVDAEGHVTGLARGTTTLTITAANGVYGIGVVSVIAVDDPIVDLIGYAVYDPSGENSYNWLTFNDYDPTYVSTLAQASSTFAAATAGSTIYGFNRYDNQFYYIDTDHGFTPVYDGLTSNGLAVLSMAYDYTTDTMYALADGSLSEPRGIYTVNRANGFMQYVCGLIGPEPMVAFAIDNAGNAYGIGEFYADFYSIDLNTGECTVIGSTGLQIAYAQSMTWDMNTNQLLWASYTLDEHGVLYKVDPETAEITRIGTIGGEGCEITGLCTLYEVDVPEPVIQKFDINFVDGYTGEIIDYWYFPGGMTLDPADFIEPPTHEGVTFLTWDYEGQIITGDTTITAWYLDPNVSSWDFEINPAYTGWTLMDMCEDENNWLWTMSNPPYFPAYEGDRFMLSFSYEGLTADDWLISPEFRGGGELSFWLTSAPSGFGEYLNEHIGLYVSTDGGETWSDELDYITVTNPYSQYFLDLSEYDGMMIKVAFRHYDSNAMFYVGIDNVEVTYDVGIIGDINGDGVITMSDASLAMRSAMNLIVLTDEQMTVADINGDGNVDLADATNIMRIALGI